MSSLEKEPLYEYTRFPPCVEPGCFAPASFSDGDRAVCNAHDAGMFYTRYARRLEPHWDPLAYIQEWAEKRNSLTADATSSPPSVHVLDQRDERDAVEDGYVSAGGWLGAFGPVFFVLGVVVLFVLLEVFL